MSAQVSLFQFANVSDCRLFGTERLQCFKAHGTFCLESYVPVAGKTCRQCCSPQRGRGQRTTPVQQPQFWEWSYQLGSSQSLILRAGNGSCPGPATLNSSLPRRPSTQKTQKLKVSLKTSQLHWTSTTTSWSSHLFIESSSLLWTCTSSPFWRSSSEYKEHQRPKRSMWLTRPEFSYCFTTSMRRMLTSAAF